ncbi:hypothetical protein SEA_MARCOLIUSPRIME_37 [Mycobacterium phage Marcoliusprime]|nr:hypothetical protein SEA_MARCOLIUSPRIME_37 [Mycobacterium phage Marcoliusprime]ASR86581.1 hypothetical protein SEA_DISMALFUNK_37 [Mycobacterium phage DismalFunk]AYB68992.1 hypothetical protein SEA_DISMALSTRESSOR_37 [Mycobacterium phage DismalStressor]
MNARGVIAAGLALGAFALGLAAPAAADPPMAHDAVLGAKCDPSGPTFGYTPDGTEVLACPAFGRWVQTGGWAGVRQPGSPCAGEGAAVSPSGRGLVCVTSIASGASTWQPGP